MPVSLKLRQKPREEEVAHFNTWLDLVSMVAGHFLSCMLKIPLRAGDLEAQTALN